MSILYDMTLSNDEDGVFAISLVDSPAIEEDYIMLSKENKVSIEIHLDQTVDNKRHVVMGPILIPDKIIPRKDYDIVFSKDTIRSASEKFMIDGKKDNVTLEHKKATDNIKFIETWIIEDSEKDKSAFYGKKYPVGTWMGTYKVLNDDVWNEFIKTGVLKGFSIEANFTLNEVKLSTEYTQEDKDILEIYLALNYTPADLDINYRWILGEETAERKNCPACKQFANKTQPLRLWLKEAIPAVQNGTIIAGEKCDFPHGAGKYGTFCEQHCSCQLVKVITSKRGATVVSPF